MRISSLLRSEVQNFFLQAQDFILPSLRHLESRLICGISEKLKWVQRIKALQKFGQTLGPYYAAYLTDLDGWQIEAVFKTIQ